MPIEVQCGQCARRYRVSEQFAGKRVCCKACRGVIVLPASPAEDDPFAHVDYDQSPPTIPYSPAIASNRRTDIAKLAIAASVGALGVLIGLAIPWHFNSRRFRPPVVL